MDLSVVANVTEGEWDWFSRVIPGSLLFQAPTEGQRFPKLCVFVVFSSFLPCVIVPVLFPSITLQTKDDTLYMQFIDFKKVIVF